MAKKAARQHRALAPIRELAGEGGGNGAAPQQPEQTADPGAAGRHNGSGPSSGNGSAAAGGPIINVGDDLISTQKRIVAGTACCPCDGHLVLCSADTPAWRHGVQRRT